MSSENDNYPTFDYREYNYPDSFTKDMSVGDIFYYITQQITGRRNVFKFKLVIVDKTHSSCNHCPLVKYHCEGLDCNIQVKKIDNIK